MSHAFINSKGEYILEVAEEVYFDATPVAELERERIIKLLEAHAETYLTTKEAIKRELSEDWHTGFADAIALIKGEK